MKRNEEKVPGFDDIIFENRNKEYGAFELRKNYPAITCYSILGVMGLSIALVIILSFSVEKESVANTPDPIVSIFKPDPAVIDLDKLKPADPEIPKPEGIKHSYLPPEIVEKVDSGNIGMAANVTYDTIQNRPVDEKVIFETNTDPVVPSVEPEPRVIVEEMPVFPGGTEALLKLIAESIKYPLDAAENNIQGRVTVKFVVSSDGSVTRIVVIGKVHPSLDEEAVRVISALPKWKPGRQNGEAVPVYYSIPVNFRLKYN